MSEYFGRTIKNIFYIFSGMILGVKLIEPSSNISLVDFLVLMGTGILFVNDFYLQMTMNLKELKKKRSQNTRRKKQ